MKNLCKNRLNRASCPRGPPIQEFVLLYTAPTTGQKRVGRSPLADAQRRSAHSEARRIQPCGEKMEWHLSCISGKCVAEVYSPATSQGNMFPEHEVSNLPYDSSTLIIVS